MRPGGAGVAIGFVAAVATAGLIACPPSPVVVAQPDSSTLDSGPSVEAGGAEVEVEAACARLRQLRCPEAEAVDGGDSCVRVFAAAQRSGKFDLKPSCVAAAVDVAAIRACKTVRCAR